MKRTLAKFRLGSTARRVFGWQGLRPGQKEAMRHLVAGRDVLLVMPTGGGKSAVYQVPALLIDGPTIVVSPLIALQRDQVMSLLKAGTGAVAVNSTQSVDKGLDQVTAGTAEFVFLSPEQLAKPEVVERLAAARPSLIAIDEAHCVSAWGHDFRPDYLRLGQVIEKLGHPPVVALTATAAPNVRAEIVRSLGLRDPVEIVRGFDRPNITLSARRFTSDDDRRKALVEYAQRSEGLTLIYVPTRKDTEEYCALLTGKRAEPYHAGMKTADRNRTHERFAAGELDVVVATSAFGMGIDRPDVRRVLHASPPESPDSYYQEIGRAGRDGEPAEAILFYRPEDLGLRRFQAGGRADPELLLRIAVLVREHGGTVPAGELRELLGIATTKLTSLANLLERAGALTPGELRWTRKRLTAEKAVEKAVELDEVRHRVDESRLDMMRGYAETTGCRRRFLLEYFGQPYGQACGTCDTCRDEAAQAAPPPKEDDGPFPVQSKVEHSAWGEGTVMSADPDRVTVLFDSVGYKTLALAAVDGILTRV
ncbi:RecQ family ATP-dependent DNA helicase [Herbidospora cretacea]|uniref:RecQ family ATP-dependent DNA helicase n=1 Tax=Herbidospora cretacea TaxID=28444 RepID=UPI000772EA20|nr:ATP-dependent DNA helicase RecQ [Herbidospora cretacea]